MTVSRTIADAAGVVPLDDGCSDTGLLGAKAGNLARARAAGLPVIDGFVIPPALAAAITAAPRGARTAPVELVRAAWGDLSRVGTDPVVVRSSSAAEDTAASSQAGVFDSVVDVRGWDDFLDALRQVSESGARAAPLAGAAPIAVLVQRHVDPERSGVLFTVDPVSGRTDRLLVATVAGGPQRLVGGLESGDRVVLDRHARFVEGSGRGGPLTRRQAHALVGLARRAEVLFGGPQDIEWAIVGGHLLLLQSRPITAVAPVGVGPVLGPGPVAETFPDALQPLETDLWLSPLRDALRVALALTGAASHRTLTRSPVVVAVDGRPAVDLELFEGGQGRRRGWALLDPRAPGRHLRVAWQVGRLRSGLPGLVDDILAGLDAELAAVPALESLDERTLVRLLERGRDALRAAHGYELLAGALTTHEGPTGAEVALAELRAGRAEGRPDAEILARSPVVLTLVPPAITGTVELPELPPGTPHRARSASAALGPREALRLRIRWLHELTARAAWLLGQRLTFAGQLPDPAAIARVDLASLAAAVRSQGQRLDPAPATLAGPPLPARFRLSADGRAVAVAGSPSEGTAAGGGRARGVVSHGPAPKAGSILVVEALDPRLAPVLSRLGGLVAATGSPLSHLAILAREHGVATVVGVPGATDRFRPGAEVLVDGATGEVRLLDRPAPEHPT